MKLMFLFHQFLKSRIIKMCHILQAFAIIRQIPGNAICHLFWQPGKFYNHRSTNDNNITRLYSTRVGGVKTLTTICGGQLPSLV